MDALENMLTRRSIRQYLPDAIPQEMIEKLLNAAMHAPSAKNMQPWRFIVVDDRAVLDKFAELNTYAQMTLQAPLAIVVCGEELTIHWDQDCSAATQNILLAAHHLGLGGVWSGIWPNEELSHKVQKLLGLPSEVKPVSLLPIGFPREPKNPQTGRYRIDYVHYNKW